jgi:hypothetical protein
MVVQVTGDGGGGRNTEKFVGHGLEIMHAEAHAYKKTHSENLHRNNVFWKKRMAVLMYCISMLFSGRSKVLPCLMKQAFLDP